MKVLVTGARGFLGRNLCSELRNIRDGKARFRGELRIEEVYEYDLDNTQEELDAFCSDCGFVFNLAGVSRPQRIEEFMEGNFGFLSTLLDTLRRHGNTCPVMLSSSQQASLAGRFGDSEYGRSKKAAENLLLEYGRQTGVRVLVYRFPNIYGKWCRPNYSSAVATFCHNVANDLPIQVNDPSVELELLYIDDLVDEMVSVLKGGEHRCEFDALTVLPRKDGRYCFCPVTHHATLGEIVRLLGDFKSLPSGNMIPEIPADSFARRLLSTYLSYLPEGKAVFDLKMNVDAGNCFTELVYTHKSGQVSINISRPGAIKGQHWHHSKWEKVIVVKGHGLIRMRPENPRPDRIGPDGQPEIREYEVSGDRMQSVIMLPGYTHSIVNLSDTEDLVTVIYCNELFDPERPDTYYDEV